MQSNCASSFSARCSVTGLCRTLTLNFVLLYLQPPVVIRRTPPQSWLQARHFSSCGPGSGRLLGKPLYLKHCVPWRIPLHTHPLPSHHAPSPLPLSLPVDTPPNPHELYSGLKEHLCPFLHCAALFFHCLSGVKFANSSASGQFQ